MAYTTGLRASAPRMKTYTGRLYGQYNYPVISESGAFGRHLQGGGIGGQAGGGVGDAAGPQVGGGGFYPFPYNTAQGQQGQQQPPNPLMPWQPAEFQRTPTPYPQSPLAPQAGNIRRRPAFGGNIQLARAAQNPGSFTHIPWAAGQSGNYMPGHGFQDQVNAQQAAEAFYRSQGLMTPLAQRWMGGNVQGSGGLAGGFQSAYDEARAENEARYRDILQGYQARRDANRGAGAQEARDIDEAYRGQAATGRQSLVSRGLDNSTLLDTMRMGVERERGNAQGRLSDRLRDQEAQLAADQLAFMERRNDTYPSYEQLAQLAQGVGAAGVGAGGVGSVTPQFVSPQSLGFQIPGQMRGVPMMGGGFYRYPMNTTATGRPTTRSQASMEEQARRRLASVASRNPAARSAAAMAAMNRNADAQAERDAITLAPQWPSGTQDYLDWVAEQRRGGAPHRSPPYYVYPGGFF